MRTHPALPSLLSLRSGPASQKFCGKRSLELPLCRDGYELMNATFMDVVVLKRQEVLNALQSIHDPRAPLYTATS